MRSHPLVSLWRLSFLLLATCGLFPSAAQAFEIRVSVKFFLDANGNRPSGTNAALNTNVEVNAQETLANVALCFSKSPYRVKIMEILDLPNTSGQFNWGCQSPALLESMAQANPSLFKWRSNMINIYIVNSACGGVCSYPVNGSIIIVGQTAKTTTFIHEIGHYMGLYHTHGSAGCGVCILPACVQPGDDGLADTLMDAQCWTTNDQMAMFNYWLPYASLNATQRQLVDQTFANIMSYHSIRLRFTATQNVVFHNTAILSRSRVVDWKHTVDLAVPCFTLDDVPPGDPAVVGLSTIFRHGDANDDQAVNLEDSLAVLKSLFIDGQPLPCADAADVSDDGRVQLHDAILILSALFQGAATPRPQRLGEPTVDLSEDDLGCQTPIEVWFTP